ncbi:alpha/beta hydrolase family protein [Myroides injenensis]|uniref:alpha/beta hydrolase family protein n=1 Tax=Myroides injenensis TaxID=1183151 RepID=UPI000289C3DB|nr:prolyl oligopeptidase family serine peptidase [Myroides injenensis]
MDIKSHLICTLSLILVTASYGQLPIDPRWHTFFNHKVSPNGQWSVIIKLYDQNADTLYVVNNETLESKTFLKIINYNFVDDNLIYLSANSNKLYLNNLISGKIDSIDNINRYTVLGDNKTILTDDEKSNQVLLLKIKDGSFKESKRFDNIIKYNLINGCVLLETKDSLILTKNPYKKSFRVIKDKKINSEVILSPNNQSILTLSQDNKLIINYIDEEKITTKKINLFVNDSITYNLVYDFIDNETLFIKVNKPNENQIDNNDVDIWSTTDKKLEAKNNLHSNNKFTLTNYVYHIPTDSLQKIIHNYSTIYHLSKISNKLIAIDEKPYKDYTSYLAFNDIITTDTFGNPKDTLATRANNYTTNTSYNPLSKLFAYKIDNQWFLYNLVDNKRIKIPIEEKQNQLYWDVSSNQIFITTNYNIWRYNFESKKLKNIFNSKNTEVEIDLLNINNFEKSKLNLMIGGDQNINSIENLFIHITDKYKANNSLYVFKQDSLKIIIENTPDKINNIRYSDDLSTITFSTENYTIPPVIYRYKNGLKEIIRTRLPKSFIQNRKQLVFKYNTTDQTELGGVLYYPLNYCSTKKYPLIVNIYQLQNSKRNVFLLPSLYNYMGFNIPFLNNNGYFVLLADTKTNHSGPGLSALDCVINSINKAKDIEPSIDTNNMGLIGHSFGGYETNFIITQTNLFKAAVSGSPINDIIWDYYSYSYNFSRPYFWRYEDKGQLDMHQPPKQNIDKYLKNSPLHHVHNIRTPLLSWTGLDDYNVHWEHTRHFFMALYRYKIPHVALFYKNEGHALNMSKNQSDLSNKVLYWFDYYLKDNNSENQLLN